ncbi:MAG: glutamine--tRNA ligase, partial [Treponema sp.]|nr:glutamine--tRNA ligase [Treponema sp.]
DKDDAGNIVAVRCTYDPATKSGTEAGNSGGPKVKGTIHWVRAVDAIPLEARLYDHLFLAERPMELASKEDGGPADFTDGINPNSLEVVPDAFAEPCLAAAKPGDFFQFERLGYFTRDTDTGADGRPVFNRTVGLRDTWAKIAGKGK